MKYKKEDDVHKLLIGNYKLILMSILNKKNYWIFKIFYFNKFSIQLIIRLINLSTNILTILT